MTRQLLRALVLKTNALWPLKPCYHAIYASALALFLRYVVRQRPEILSVYLRGPGKGRNWVPGLSDIDLTVIIASGLSREMEYSFLESFWAANQRLKSVFPMLEVKILNQDEFGGWLAGTSYSPDRADWRLVYGEANAYVQIEATPGWRLRALQFAWWIYEGLLPACLALPDSFVRNRDIQRRVEKILRLLAPILSEAGHFQFSTARSSGPADLVASSLKALETVALHVLPIQQFPNRFLPHQLSTNHPRDLAPRPRMLRSRIGEDRMLVFEDGLDTQAITRIIVSSSRADGRAPLVLPRCLLEYWVRFYNPYDYLSFSRHWAAADGAHPLEDIVPPNGPEFLTYSLNRIRHLQVISRTEELFTQGPSVAEVKNTLAAATVLRLHQNGRALFPRNEVFALWPAEFPEYQSAVERIASLIEKNQRREACQSCFLVFRSVTSQLGPLIDASQERQEQFASTVSVE